MVQCLTFWPGYRRVRTQFEASLPRLDNGIGAKRASCTGVSVHEYAELRSVRHADNCAPVWDQVPKQPQGHEGVVVAGEGARALDQGRSCGVRESRKHTELRCTYRAAARKCRQSTHERVTPLLPKVPPIPHGSGSSACIGDGTPPRHRATQPRLPEPGSSAHGSASANRPAPGCCNCGTKLTARGNTRPNPLHRKRSAGFDCHDALHDGAVRAGPRWEIFPCLRPSPTHQVSLASFYPTRCPLLTIRQTVPGTLGAALRPVPASTGNGAYEAAPQPPLVPCMLDCGAKTTPGAGNETGTSIAAIASVHAVRPRGTDRRHRTVRRR